MTQFNSINFKVYCIVISSVYLFSCQEKKSTELLIGNWKLVLDTTEQIPPPPFGNRGRGRSYSFLNDSVVDTKTDYYKIIKSKTRDEEFRFIGTTTKYKIVADSIKIYNLTDSVWGKGKKIKKITHDTLVLIESGGQESVYKRYDYKIGEKPYLDQIALSTSGCFGSCPVMNIIINSNGDVVFQGEMYVDKLGFYEGQIPEETFLQIEYEFRKANIQQLKGEYAVDWSDDETISTTFCRQNKFVNTIEDYGKAGPDELVWSYYPLRYLFQTLELTRIDSTKLPFYLNLHYFRFERKDEVCVLTQSESFLLWNYLRKGTIVQNSFDENFNLSFVRNYIWAPSSDEIDDPYDEKSESRVRSIVSDGRNYTFEIEGQRQITIDIGFNFFEINRPFLQFRKKNQYD